MKNAITKFHTGFGIEYYPGLAFPRFGPNNWWAPTLPYDLTEES